MQLRQASSLDDVDGALPVHGGTEVVPLLRAGLLEADTLVDIRGVIPRGIEGTRIGAGATLAELECDPQVPAALREACKLAASPQLRNMGSVGGNLLQATRCWYWRLDWPCRLHGGDECFAHAGEHREHAIFANDYCASAHPSDVAAALLALDATLRTNQRELPIADLYRVPTEDDRRTTTLEPGELILELNVPEPDALGLPEGDGAKALGVSDGRRRRSPLRQRDPRRAGRSGAHPVAVERRSSARRLLSPATPTRWTSRRRS